MAIYAYVILSHTIFSVPAMRVKDRGGFRAPILSGRVSLNADTYQRITSYSEWSFNCTSIAEAGT